MKQLKGIITCGAIVAVLPFLGLPIVWKNGLVTLFGILIVSFAVYLVLLAREEEYHEDDDESDAVVSDEVEATPEERIEEILNDEDEHVAEPTDEESIDTTDENESLDELYEDTEK